MEQFKGVAVTIDRIRKQYGSQAALSDISLSIQPGEFVSLLGPSGSGKTTLLMIIAGFSQPDSGSIKFGDEEVVHISPHRRNIGVVFQNYALFPHMNVGENVAYPLRVRRMARIDIARRVEQVLSLVKLEKFADRKIDMISGGQRQRVALARAIVFGPKILVMDEPLSALDKQLREEMQFEIRRLHGQLGMTTITVTHDQREALTMSNRVAVIDAGRLMQFATPKELYEQPQNRFVAGFIGESAFVPFEGRTLVMRPERLSVASDDSNLDGNWLRFAGVVANIVYQGESVAVKVNLSVGADVIFHQATSYRAGGTALRVGQGVMLVLHRNDAIYIDA